MLLYEDRHLIIASKRTNELSEFAEHANSLPARLFDELSLKEPPHPVHRLDREVGGAILLAKDAEAMARCSKLVSAGLIQKNYLAITNALTIPANGDMQDYLFKQSSTNKSYVVDRPRKGVKEAKLSYKLIGEASFENENLYLFSVIPHTGRTHQIRVQFASRKMPLLGDSKYGSSYRSPIGLMCYSIEFPHPYTQKMLRITAKAPTVFPFSVQFSKTNSIEDETDFSQFFAPHSL